MYRKHILSIIAIVLMVWTTSLLMVELNHLHDKVEIVRNANGSPTYIVPSYQNILYRPLVSLDSQFVNPNNDPDGPFIIGFFFFPILAFILSGIDTIVTSQRKKETKQDRFAATTLLVSLILPVILIGIQYVFTILSN